MARRQFNSNRERFKTLAENRTNSVLAAIRILSHCSNKALYDYESDEIDRIFNAIEESLKEIKAKFKDKKQKRFQL